MGRVPLQRCKGTKNRRGGHDETSAVPPCFICCPAPVPRGNGSSAQNAPCIRRSGNRTVPAPIRLPPRSVQSVRSSIQQGACCAATFVPAQQPGTVGWPRNMAGLYAQRQQVGAECVVTRCRVSGNPRPVLHPKEVLRNHGFLSAFFVSFVARQKTPARGRNYPLGWH